MALDPTPILAAIRYDIGFEINQLIRDVVNDLRLQGLRIGGVLQEAEFNDDPNCVRLHVVDIRTGETACITQDRGRDAHGCKLDPSGLADISHCITDAIKAGVDLIIINKFGRAESEGAGLLSCIGEAVSAGVPILTTVRDPYVEAWGSFHGGLAADLPPLKSAVLDWCRASCQQPEMAPALVK